MQLLSLFHLFPCSKENTREKKLIMGKKKFNMSPGKVNIYNMSMFIVLCGAAADSTRVLWNCNLHCILACMSNFSRCMIVSLITAVRVTVIYFFDGPQNIFILIAVNVFINLIYVN